MPQEEARGNGTSTVCREATVEGAVKQYLQYMYEYQRVKKADAGAAAQPEPAQPEEGDYFLGIQFIKDLLFLFIFLSYYFLSVGSYYTVYSH